MIMRNKIVTYFGNLLVKVVHAKDFLLLNNNIDQQQNHTQPKSLLKLLIYQKLRPKIFYFEKKSCFLACSISYNHNLFFKLLQNSILSITVHVLVITVKNSKMKNTYSKKELRSFL